MFRQILCIVVFLGVSGESLAQTLFFADNYTIVKKGSHENVTDAAFQKGITKKFGIYTWSQASTVYQEAYIGPYVQVSKWLQVGVGGGVDKLVKTEGRVSTFAYIAKGKHSIFANYGDGGSGPWYTIQTKYAITSRLAVGFHSEQFVGHGARSEFAFPLKAKWTPSIWSSVFWDKNTGARPNLMIGVRATYFKED